jgi:hypothetical protein
LPVILEKGGLVGGVVEERLEAGITVKRKVKRIEPQRIDV